MRMKAIKFCFFWMLLVFNPVTFAGTGTFNAGIARMEVSGDSSSSEALVWYPTEAAEVPWQAGPFLVPASGNAKVADGKFPVVLLSHGGGPTGGTPLILRELSSALARQGFIVIAPFHGKAPLKIRPQQVMAAWKVVLADSRFQSHMDAERLGMIGFSLGGAVTLELAGAIPNISHYQTYCDGNPDDTMSCNHAPDGNNSAYKSRADTSEKVSPRLPIKALVLLDPFAVLFQRAELSSVTVPILLFRPIESQLPADVNANGLLRELPRPPEFSSIPGEHFVFTDVCSSELRFVANEICHDPVGVDRVAVHRVIETRIEAFFKKNM